MNHKLFRKPEILAPAGDIERAYLAAEAGADAIYFGLSTLSARSAATNIQDTQLPEMVKDLHKLNTRCYVTVNTILYQSEFQQAQKYLEICDEAKVDALIIQDLAWLKIIAEYEKKKPLKMEIHASTQMNIHSDLDIIAARKLGFDRIVLPREVSKKQLILWSDLCKEKKLDIEIFVHGALCMATSGRCQMSFSQGGRSANRGACAQACRLPYRLFDTKHNLLDQGALLSAKDQSLLSEIPTFYNLNTKSLKIEGRMKNSSYVLATTSAFRNAVDFWAENQDEESFKEFVLEEELKLLQVFNRGGSFTQRSFLQSDAKDYVSKDFVGNYGIYLGKIKKVNVNKGEISLQKLDKKNNQSTQAELNLINTLQPKDQIAIRGANFSQIAVAPIGKIEEKKTEYIIKGFHPQKLALMQINDRAFLLKNVALEEKLKNNCDYKYPLNIEIEFHQNKINLKGIAKLPNTNIKAELPVLLKDMALSDYPLSQKRWQEQFSKLGNSKFFLENIKFLYTENTTIPALRVSQINQLRRNLLEKLSDEIASKIEYIEKENLNRKAQNIFEKKIKTKEIETDIIQKQNLYSLVFSEQLNNLNLIDLSEVDQLEIPMLFLSNLKINQKLFLKLFEKYKKLEILIRLPEIMQQKQYELFEILRDAYLYEPKINFSANGISTIFPDLYYGKLKHINEQANIINDKALQYYLSHGKNQISLSQEWNDQSLDQVLSDLDDATCSRIYLPKNYLTAEMFLNYCPVGKNITNCKKCITNAAASWSHAYILKGQENTHHLITYPIHCVSQIYTNHVDNQIFNNLSGKNKKRINIRTTLK